MYAVLSFLFGEGDPAILTPFLVSLLCLICISFLLIIDGSRENYRADI
jgi:hypothetical protein